MKPDHENIVNVSILCKMSLWIARKKDLFQFGHEGVGVVRRHSDDHCSATYLTITVMPHT